MALVEFAQVGEVYRSLQGRITSPYAISPSVMDALVELFERHRYLLEGGSL
jgi:hypothetical protein